MGPTAIIPSSNMLSIDDENWQPIVDPDGDADAPRPTELSPELHEYKVISPAGQPRAIMIHCKCSRSLCVFFRSLKEAAAPDDMLHRGTGRLVEESLDAPCKNDWLSRCARWSRPSDKQ